MNKFQAADFHAIRQAIASLPDCTELESLQLRDRSCKQLQRTILMLKANPESVGIGDLAGVVRHVLRRASINGLNDFLLRIPKKNTWPAKKLWNDSHVNISGEDSNVFLLTANDSWQADWLPSSDKSPPLEAAYSEEVRRIGWPPLPGLPLDTALKYGLDLPFEGYQSPGQRHAIHSAFFLAPGGTLVVNLPTGSGKSMVAWAPALCSQRNELTVMITPTISLAIDQEKQLHDFPKKAIKDLPKNLAWHSGLSEEVKREVRDRLKSGTQRIIITSPESLCGALSRYVYKAAEQGRLKYLVVDEAHLVSQWGNEFRPAFQAMSGIRRDLLAISPPGKSFRTLLLSATLTQESFDVLQTLFSEGIFDVVNAVSLRPEPEYWINQSFDKGERRDKVKQLIRVLPRPFLIYSTTRRDAEYWNRTLEEMGILRRGCVHGSTDSDERDRVIELWRKGDIDCISATSAFGLGMDKKDVRAVVHACIPESVDRFYQEVGRSGRDGTASVSFLLSCEEADYVVASTISQERIISCEEGLKRWKALIGTSRHSESGNRVVNLNTRPAHINQDSDANAAWNLRTLVLLNRSGVISLQSSPPPEIKQAPGESDREYQTRWESSLDDYYSSTELVINDEFDDHLSPELWHNVVEPNRKKMFESSGQAFGRMKELLGGNREVGSLLRETYTIDVGDSTHHPQVYCGGCPVCRETTSTNFNHYLNPVPDRVRNVSEVDTEKFKEIFLTATNIAFVSVADSKDIEPISLTTILPKLVRMGIWDVVIPQEWETASEWHDLPNLSPHRFIVGQTVCRMNHLQTDLLLPRITFLNLQPNFEITDEFVNIDSPFHIVVAARSARDAATGKKFFDLYPGISFEEFVRRLGQA